MRKKFILWLTKFSCAGLSFLLIFILLQNILTPRFAYESTSLVDAYSKMETNSIDVLFLGSSQMYCSIDSEKLTKEYNLSSINLGAAAQPLLVTKFYFNQALKSQSPKVICLEVATAFNENTNISEDKIAWSYSPISPSIDKFNSLYEVFDGNFMRAFMYTYTPLFIYHERWNSIKKSEIEYMISNRILNSTIANRGYVRRDNIEKQSISFFQETGEKKTMPKESMEAIIYMKNHCDEKNIKLLLFKSPNSTWGKNESESIKQFVNKNGIDFIDLHEHIEDIGFDSNHDFSDEGHLNYFGAQKVTDFMAKVVSQYD